MSLALLKPQVLGYKNTFLGEFRRRRFNKELLMLFFSTALVFATYRGTSLFLERLVKHPGYDISIAAALLDLCLFAFFLLLIFSSSIASLGFLFSAKDIPLLLSAPVSLREIFNARMLSITGNASWMFSCLGFPRLRPSVRPWTSQAVFTRRHLPH